MVDPSPLSKPLPEQEQPLEAVLSPAARLLHDGLRQRWEKFTGRLARCQTELREENVHDLRVSMRRLIAMLVMCQAVMPALKTKGLRREIKAHLDNLDTLRDTQVMRYFLTKHYRRNESAIPLLTYLEMQEAHLLRKVDHEIGSMQVMSLLEGVTLLGRTIEASLTGTGIEGVILSVVDEAYADVKWKRVNVNPQDLATVHAMRIAFKKFRYMLELATPLVPPMPSSRPKVLHHYQGMMGDVQDGVVLLEFIERFSQENTQFDVRPVREASALELEKRMAYFLARIDRLRLFWRKSPGTRFPWRSSTGAPPMGA